jgi:DNA-binding CsgD family transcriptional regulator
MEGAAGFMMNNPIPFPSSPFLTLAERRSLLQNADRAILSLAGGSHYLLYRAVHQFAAALAPLDSFYIGFCQEADRTIVYPYNFDGREYDDPNINPYQPGGVTEWIVANRRSYWSRSDEGELLHRGRPFGDICRRSAEGIVVPLFEKTGKRSPVTGLVSILSYAPGVYMEENVWAMECLAESLSTALQREREDEARRSRRSGGRFTERAEMSSGGTREVFLLKCIRRRVEDVRAQISESKFSSDAALIRAVDALAQECERSQTETLELALRAAGAAESPLRVLTPREQEVAAFLVSGMTNRQIAARLFISEKTAKTHVGSIIRKLGAGGRSGVAQILKLCFTSPTMHLAPTPLE